MINLKVNGKPRYLDESVDLATYLDSFGVDQLHVAVGYNGEVLKKEMKLQYQPHARHLFAL